MPYASSSVARMRTTPRNRSAQWTMACSMSVDRRAAGLKFCGQQLLRARDHDLFVGVDSARQRDPIADAATKSDDFPFKRVLFAQNENPRAALMIDDRAAGDDERLRRFADTRQRRAQRRAR